MWNLEMEKVHFLLRWLLLCCCFILTRAKREREKKNSRILIFLTFIFLFDLSYFIFIFWISQFAVTQHSEREKFHPLDSRYISIQHAKSEKLFFHSFLSVCQLLYARELKKRILRVNNFFSSLSSVEGGEGWDGSWKKINWINGVN